MRKYRSHELSQTNEKVQKSLVREKKGHKLMKKVQKWLVRAKKCHKLIKLSERSESRKVRKAKVSKARKGWY